MRNGILCQTIISLHLKKGAKPPPIEDFMVYEESEKEDGRMDEDQIKDFCEKLAANFKR